MMEKTTTVQQHRPNDRPNELIGCGDCSGDGCCWWCCFCYRCFATVLRVDAGTPPPKREMSAKF